MRPPAKPAGFCLWSALSLSPLSDMALLLMILIEKQLITAPGDQGDGLTLCDGRHYVIRDCLIDFSSLPLNEIDEALGVTWGCSAEIYNCVFRGAGKLVLCGSGDSDKLALEKGKKVVFNDCLFENFSRRGPEVQDGMLVEMNRCLVRGWASADRFTVRTFGAWAHGAGSRIEAHDCVFWQDEIFGRHFIRDFLGHFGQAVNDGGIKAIFSREAWLPGAWRGLVASNGGQAKAKGCYANHPWIILDNRSSRMEAGEAMRLIAGMEKLKARLMRELGKDGRK